MLVGLVADGSLERSSKLGQLPEAVDAGPGAVLHDAARRMMILDTAAAMTRDAPATEDVSSVAGIDLDTFDEVQRRVLWLAVRIVDAANRERDAGDGIKVGGHQASSASLVTVMTALWLAYLRAADRVSVKPHASPVLHALWYLLGDLDRSYLAHWNRS